MILPPSYLVRRLLASSLSLGAVAARTLGALPGGACRNGWRELRAKLDAFRWYQQGRGGVAPGARGAGTFTRMWRTEGEACRRSELWRPGQRPPPTGSGPGKLADLVPLHAGVSVALAIRALDELSGGESISRALDRFLEATREAAVTGWEGVAFEGLGLVAWTLHPQRLPAIDGELGCRKGNLQKLFWHGVGRGVYFKPGPTLRVCTATRRAFALGRSIPPDENACAQVLAGISWALTLVNLRRPGEVAEALLQSGADLVQDGPVEHGVCSALLVWIAAAGWDDSVERFLTSSPRATLDGRPWGLLLQRCAAALGRLAPRLATTSCLAELFCFRPLSELDTHAETRVRTKTC